MSASSVAAFHVFDIPGKSLEMKLALFAASCGTALKTRKENVRKRKEIKENECKEVTYRMTCF